MSNVAYCQACRRPAAVKYCEYTQGIGMLVLRTQRRIRGQMCRNCASRYFWELNSLTLLTGWWGIISFISNIFYIVSNVSYFISSRALPAPGTGAFPVQAGQPVAGPPPVQGSLAAPVAPAQHPLATYRQDILLRLRGGQTPAQVAQYISSQTRTPAADVESYIRTLVEGRM